MAEAMNQVTQMREFILNEAKDKAEEIDAKALQEFTIEKFKIVNQMKHKIREEYQKKLKQVETKNAIERSSAINRSRLEKIKSRQDVLGKVADGAKTSLMEELKAEAKNKTFITNLIVQGLLMLLEEQVEVRCRACDDKLVESCLEAASKQYSEVILQDTGAKLKVKCTLDKANKLPPAPSSQPGPSCLGGVVLVCSGNTITIDNTIDARLSLVLEQAKPNIRKLMFSS
jgi:V-type H+-transporting ATPase subunit E